MPRTTDLLYLTVPEVLEGVISGHLITLIGIPGKRLYILSSFFAIMQLDSGAVKCQRLIFQKPVSLTLG